jgi:bacteriocin biosynthesis cyclodehydratase domain-containing protein
LRACRPSTLGARKVMQEKVEYDEMKMPSLEGSEAKTTYRVAAGVVVDDRAGALQIYVAENQRGFAVAGIAAEILLDLLAFTNGVEKSFENFVAEYARQYDDRTLEDAWISAISIGMLVEQDDQRSGVTSATTRVSIVGPSGAQATQTLRRELRDLGVHEVSSGDRPALILGVDDIGDDRGLVELGRSLPWTAVPWLPVQLLHERITVGPLVFPGDTACFECAMTRQGASLMPDGVRRWGGQPIIRPGSLERRAGAKVAGAVIRNQVQSLDRREPPSLTSRLLTYDLLSATQRTSFVLEVPGCKTCRQTDGLLR